MTVGAYMTPAAVVASIIIKRTLKFKYLIIVGWILLAVGTGLNVTSPFTISINPFTNTIQFTMHPNSSKVLLYAPRCISAIGAGLLFPSPLFAVQARQLNSDIGVATSMQVFSRSLGNTFGVALGGTIFQNQWAKLIPSLPIPEGNFVPSNLAEVGYDLISTFPEDVQEIYRWLYSDSLDALWWFLTAICLAGLLCGLLARNELLRGSVSDKQGFEDSEVHGGLQDREKGMI
jgi:hypothetical protein